MRIVGVVRPLPILANIWTEISMDFIMGLLKAYNKSIITVFVSHLPKCARFCTLSRPPMPSTIIHVFMDPIFKLHCMSASIVLNRDPTFAYKFIYEQFELWVIRSKMSIDYQPQIDGQAKVVNKFLEAYPRCFASNTSMGTRFKN